MSATKYYVDANGVYLGGWGEDLTPPSGAVEVPTAPTDARLIWNGTTWTGTIEYADPDAVAYLMLYAGAPWELWSLFSLLKSYGSVPDSRKACWAQIKSQNPAWLTQTLIDEMESYCAANGMSLTW